MKNTQIYKVNHPTIKEITIGDQFVLNSGEIVTFVEFDKGDFQMTNGWYNHQLMYKGFFHDKNFGNHIKRQVLTLKNKLDLL